MNLSLIVVILSVLVAAALAVWAILALKKQQSGIKAMLLGISVMLSGGFLTMDASMDSSGVGYVIVLLGLLISVYGFAKKE